MLRAQGRLRKLVPTAIIDIGSNSVRLVVFEGLSRSPTPLFNEKILCGLGAHIATTNRLDDVAVERALSALRRFRLLAAQAGADSIHTLATAAAREAENGPDFIDQAEAILGHEIHVLTGEEEAHYAALGVVCGFERPKGISADMGGGSVELVPVDRKPLGEGISLPFGGLRLQETSGESVAKARALVKKSIAKHPMLLEAKGGTFYAIGGTWRAMARFHQARYKYPLSVMHHYELTAEQARHTCKRLMAQDAEKARGMKAVSSSRRALLPYGAALLYEIMKVMQPERIVISGVGVREGYLYSLLPENVQKADPLITAAEEMAVLRARSPIHARELSKWTGEAFSALGVDESRTEKRYRKAACLLADVTWRSHPDYRGGQALNILSNANFVGIDHPGRAYIALSTYYRHEGLMADDAAPSILSVATPRIAERARLLGALFRVAYLLSAAMPEMLPRIRFERLDEGEVVLSVPQELADIYGERLQRRIDGLAGICEREIGWQVG
ncbi:exopolyphosphatase [Pseudahrensia aquimaris]|uniref:exopolyphosphatase n=1 Tax=Pseudahrensia aquimaris TaxID=744461 RepID=A0ABW3FFD2_9HYPH